MAGLDWLIARPVAHRGLHDAQKGVIENNHDDASRGCCSVRDHILAGGAHPGSTRLNPSRDIDFVESHDLLWYAILIHGEVATVQAPHGLPLGV